MSDYHIPVLLKACIRFLNIQPDGTYVDLTFGGGGHSRAILDRLGDKGRLFAFDQDEDAARNVIHDPRFKLVPQNFRYLQRYLRVYGVTAVDGILGDLGVSSHQFDEASRGFSIRFNGPLDMRMNRQNVTTAAQVLRDYSERELLRVFRNYGEVTNAPKLVRAIATARAERDIATTDDLRAAIKSCTPPHEESKYLARVFQALRIEVNGEMDALRECLTQCAGVLKPGGRLVMLSYHSLEDRMVKQLIRSGDPDGKETRDVIYGTRTRTFENLTPKPVEADESEKELNPRSRSAKLRAAEKL